MRACHAIMLICYQGTNYGKFAYRPEFLLLQGEKYNLFYLFIIYQLINLLTNRAGFGSFLFHVVTHAISNKIKIDSDIIQLVVRSFA